MKSTTRFSRNNRGIECLNCKQPLSDSDNFCSNCGQVNDTLPLSIKQFISEFFAGFFSFDTRFFKTFVPLLFKPGKVPKDYIEGKRRRYVNPFQLYLNVTIVFFLLQGLFSTIDEYKVVETSSKEKTGTAIDTTKIKTPSAEKTKLTKDSASANLPLFKTNDSLSTSNPDDITKNLSKTDLIKQKLLYRIDSVFATTNILKQLNDSTISKNEKDSIYENFYKSNINFISKQVNNNAKNDDWEDIQKMSALNKEANDYAQQTFNAKNVDYTISDDFNIALEDNLIKKLVGQRFFKKISDFLKYHKENKNATAIEAMEDLGLEKTRWNAFYYKMAQNINKMKEDSEFRNSYVKSIISKISIALFFLLPIFTLFLSLLYLRHKWNYTEHLVLVFNVQTVFFLLLIFFTIFDRLFDTDLGILLFILVFLFYLFKTLLNFYGQHWFKTSIKFILLNVFYYILSSIGLLIVSFIAFIL